MAAIITRDFKSWHLADNFCYFFPTSMSFVVVEDEKDILIFKENNATITANTITSTDDGHDSTSTDDDGTTTKESNTNDSAQEAYDPETGEINWDCPCIAPMVQPPCGDKFKEAFSCFVYSTKEPKGSECIEQFREMQACFQANPDIYGDNES